MYDKKKGLCRTKSAQAPNWPVCSDAVRHFLKCSYGHTTNGFSFEHDIIDVDIAAGSGIISGLKQDLE